MTRVEHFQSLREKRRAQFEEKRELARAKMQEAILMTNGTKEERMRGGQLGQPLRQFSEV